MKPIHGMLLSLLPVLTIPMVSMTDFSPGQPDVASEKDAVLSESSPPSPRYLGIERFEEPSWVKLEKIQRILKDFKTGLPPSEERKLARLIYEESLAYQYDPELILAIILAESSFNSWSRSHMGAIGLMQIMPATGSSLAKAKNISWMGNITLFDPYLNVKLGIQYLAMMHDEFDDLQVALTAYNYGPTRVREMLRHCERLPRSYSQKVMSAYKVFLELKPPSAVES